jgi:acetolactate synthase I/II/III large subunit
VQDAVAILRDYTKWDDNPVSLQHFGESTVGAYQLAMTPPTMPIVLVAAENPVIVTSRSARTPAGLKSLVELAELLQCAVVDQHRRMNFPTRHPLNQSWDTRT